MARTVLTPTAFAADAWLDVDSVFAAANADGHYIEASDYKQGRLVLWVKNTNAAPRDLTVLAGSGGDTGPAFRADLGDLLVEIAATSGEQAIYLSDTARFAQSDGRIHIDFEAVTNVTVALFALGDN